MPKKTVRDDESRFLESYRAEDFDRPSMAVDVVLLTVRAAAVQALLLKRRDLPHRGRWALPGGFVDVRRPLEDKAVAVLREKAGLTGLFLEQLFTFGRPDRDPRTRVISVAYFALVDATRLEAALGETDERVIARLEVDWEAQTGGPVTALASDGRPLRLAFDHAEILGMAVKRLRGKLPYTPIGYQLLPEIFSLRDLQEVHETVLGHPINKDSFRRRMLASGDLEATGRHEDAVDHRPAEFYRFARRSAT